MAKRIQPYLVLAILLFPVLCLADLSSNLVAFYPFNGNANDESGQGHHGVLMNGACLTEDRFGNLNSAAGFDGIDDYIQTDLLQDNVTSYSISLWVKTTSTNWLVPFVQDRGGLGQSLTLGLRGSNEDGTLGHLFFALDADQILVGAHSSQSINDGRWHHVVGVWDGSGGAVVNSDQFSIYIDGVKAAVIPFSSPYSFYPPLTGSGGTAIGFHSAWALFFAGAMDDVFIYSRALSEEEIYTLYRPTPCERAERIIATVISLELSRKVEKSYLTALRKVCPLVESGKINAALKQLTAFIQNVRQDIRRGVIDAAAGNNLMDMATRLIAEISG